MLQSPVRCLQVNVPEERIIAGFEDSLLRLFDLHTGLRLWDLENHRGGINDLSFNAQRMVSAADDKTVRIWNMNVGQCVAKLEGTLPSSVLLLLSPVC